MKWTLVLAVNGEGGNFVSVQITANLVFDNLTKANAARTLIENSLRARNVDNVLVLVTQFE
jgi:hypothetical protein